MKNKIESKYNFPKQYVPGKKKKHEFRLIKINDLKYLYDDVEVYRDFSGKWIVKGFLTKGQFTDFLNRIKNK